MDADYSACVFINCPFDGTYRQLLFAATFAIFDCGYIARCAQEVDDAGEVRVDKIMRIIRACKFGIHDISEVSASARGLPRFNMPFELGLFLGARYFGEAEQKHKVTMVLDRVPFRYQEFLSDIGGQDITIYNGTAESIIHKIRDWLSQSTGRSTIPGGRRLVERYNEFQANLPELCERLQWTVDDLLFNEYAQLCSVWLESTAANDPAGE